MAYGFYINAPSWAIYLGVLFALLLVPNSFIAWALIKYKKRKAEESLEFTFEQRPPYEDIKFIGDSDEIQSYKFRVGVRNVSGKHLKSCCVVLQALSPSDGTWFSRPLKLARDNPPDVLNTSHMQSFQLYPEDEEIIDIVFIDKRQKFIKIAYAKEDQRDLQIRDTIPIGDYCFTLRAGADFGSSCRETFCLKINLANNKITFSRFSEFAKLNQMEAGIR